MDSTGTRPARPGPTQRVRVVDVRADQRSAREDRLAAEEPLEIRLAWPAAPPRRLAVTMRTPGRDFDLAAGFVLGEGLAHADQIHTVAYCTDTALPPDQDFNVVTVELGAPPTRPLPERQSAVSSACGVCGKDSLAAVTEFGGSTVVSDLQVPSESVRALPDLLRAQQRLFERTGGLHAAGLFEPDTRAVLVREDVGRHNAVDKLVGACALQRLPTRDRMLCTSGRAGFEIVQKAVLAQIPVVVAVGAPSSLAVACAQEFDVTLTGFTRADRCVVYAGGSRIGV
ncbi:MAG TPA: formate dehydrogenase accessory sulfurtransferase FdhD [Nocardioidaceae bacterium]|nr:formate dehydrogenase accessory sulfurtransferase FdhD [Nocardioidaceae bacterium]